MPLAILVWCHIQQKYIHATCHYITIMPHAILVWWCHIPQSTIVSYAIKVEKNQTTKVLYTILNNFVEGRWKKMIM